MSCLRQTYQGCSGCSFAFLSLVLLGFIFSLFTTAGPFRSTRANGLNAREANKKLWHGDLPVEATDVWLVSSYRATVVECTLDEDGFLAWCRCRGWRLTTITSGLGHSIWSMRDGAPTPIIEDGYEFNERAGGDVGFFGFYDRTNKRAYVTYTCG
jgi:hypothetical protein